MDLVASLSNAHIIVFLITHDFMADKLITSSRLDDFLVANTRKRVTAISVLVDQIVAWENEAISRLPRLPTDGVPLSGWKKRSQAFSNIVEGIRQAALDTIEDREWRIDGQNNANTPVGAQRLDLGEVFPVVGLPDVTFVEPDKYLPFRMAIRQKGLGIVLEGPSGVGKTTLLRSVLTRDSSRVGVFRILSARNPLHAAEIKELPRTGHEGLIAIDDFHRLEPEDRQAISDYLKLTADAGEAGRLVLIGIPGIGQHLVDLNYDLANRIRVLKLGRVSDERIMELITRGEQALNIRFERKSEIVAACAGSLLTAQAICGHLASIAHIEETMPQLTVVRTDLPSARARVAEEVAIKYEPIVKKFAQLDRSHEDACIQILIEVAQSIDGHLALESFVKENGAYSETISGVFFTGPLSGGVNDADMLRHIFYDHQARRLIIDDPQLIFYLRELSASGMRELVGKTLPVPREQVFVCYSRRDSVWLDRLRAHLKPFENRQRIDVWSDRRIELGDNWLNEIQDALARARFALLLVSADFLASDFISQVELPALLAAAKDGGCRVIPILVKASAFMEIDELSLFQHPSLQGKTLSSMPEEEAEEVLAKVAREVARFSKQPTRS